MNPAIDLPEISVESALEEFKKEEAELIEYMRNQRISKANEKG